MINSIRGCVACDDPWPWPISSRSFGLDLENWVRSVASTVLDGLFLYLAQMITIIKRCDLNFWQYFKNFRSWPWKKNLQFSMDSFHIYHKWSQVWEGVLHIMTLTYIFKVIWPWPWKLCPLCCIYSSWWTHSIFGQMINSFDIDLYLQGHSTLTLKIVSTL